MQKYPLVASFLAFALVGCAHSRSEAKAPAPVEPPAIKGAKVVVHGHRGARWSRPENTIPAFEFALRRGVDVLEMDLNVTKDDHLVIHHDPALNPEICLGPGGKKIEGTVLIRSLTLKQLKEYDCGTLRNPRFPRQEPVPGTKVSTIDEFFRWLKDSKLPGAQTVKLNIEMKSEEAHPEYAPEPARFAKLYVDALKRNHALDRTIIQSFDYRTLVEARKLAPKSVISVLVEFRPNEPLVDLARRYGANYISSDYEWLTKDDADSLHAAGVKLAPWTVNDPAAWKKLIDWKVEEIITDDPQGLLSALGR